MLLVLLAAVLVPALCVLWFMNAAMESERLAVRQRLTDVYRRQMEDMQGKLNADIESLSAVLDAAAAMPPAEAFAGLVKTTPLDGVVILDGQGRVVHPAQAADLSGVPAESPATAPASAPSSAPASPTWDDAQELEQADLAKAAAAYGAIAQAAADPTLQARALQAQVRCLDRSGDQAAARRILAQWVARPELAAALDDQGRVLAPGAMLRLLQLLPQGRERSELAARLVQRVNDYSAKPPLPAAQRVFLMRELLAAGVSPSQLPTLSAEELSIEQAPIISSQEILGVLHPDSSSPPRLRQTQPGKQEIWCVASHDGPMVIVALLRDSRVEAMIQAAHPPRDALPGAVLTCRYARPSPENAAFLSSAIRSMPAWELSLSLEGGDPFARAAERQNALYLYTGSAGIVFIVLLAVAMASYLGRQMKLTRLRNDLIATISHELRTPLASMRVLVDTLREGRLTGAAQEKEYLELIAGENERLSRLIDNFLTFSRMERNKRVFIYGPLGPGELVRAAAAAMRERFSAPGAKLELDVPSDLPELTGDRDALMTVLLNLLDNAWKYSGDQKHVAVRAYLCGTPAPGCEEAGTSPGSGGNSPRRATLCIEVRDNGIGLSRRAMRRIFDRFYQVDQTLSRRAGGCGLGLSIVKFILDAHGGLIEVKSQLGKGSAFTVRLPIHPPAEAQ